MIVFFNKISFPVSNFLIGFYFGLVSNYRWLSEVEAPVVGLGSNYRWLSETEAPVVGLGTNYRWLSEAEAPLVGLGTNCRWLSEVQVPLWDYLFPSPFHVFSYSLFLSFENISLFRLNR